MTTDLYNLITEVADLGVDQRDAYPVIMEEHTAFSPVLVQLLCETEEVTKTNMVSKPNNTSPCHRC